MIDVALISGKEDRAFLLIDGAWYRDSSNSRASSSPIEVRIAVNGSGEYEMLQNPTDIDVQVARELHKRRADCLFTTLSVLDIQISISTRMLMAQQAEILLQAAGSRAFVQDRILSRPLPAETVTNRHSLMQVAKNFDAVGTMLHDIFGLQSSVWMIQHLFVESAESVGLAPDAVTTLRSELMASGFFAASLRALSAKSLHEMNSVIVSELLNRDVGTQHRPFFLEFQRRTQAFSFGSSESTVKTGRLFDRRGNANHSSVQQRFRSVPDASPNFKVFHPNLSPFKAKERVDKQLSQIKELIFLDKIPLAEKFIKELMEFQLERDDREYAAMSLCNLSSTALEANQIDLAEALVEYAMDLAPADAVPFTARAEVYRARGQFPAAIEMFDAVLQRFSSGSSHALNGKANVLSEMARFEEAATLYQNIQVDFVDDPVAFNGEVSLLHTKGKHREALKLALDNTKRFPLDAVTRAVLAGALSRNGKYAEAVRHYHQAWKLDSTNTRSLVGAAFALRSDGRPSEALSTLNLFLKDNPHVMGVLNAKALILRGQMRFSEAQDVYESMLELFPRFTPARLGLKALAILQGSDSVTEDGVSSTELESEIDWIGFRTLMAGLIKAGRASLAAEMISKAITTCPWLKQRTLLNTILGIAQIESDQPRSVHTLQEDIQRLDDRHRQARLLFLSHAQIKQDNPDVGQMIISRMITTKDVQLREIRSRLYNFSNLTVSAKSDLLANELEFAMAA